MSCVTALCDDCGAYQPIDIDGFFFVHRAPCGAWCGTRGPRDPNGAVCLPHVTSCSQQSRALKGQNR